MLQMEGAAHRMNGEADKAAELWLRASRISPNVPLHDLLASYYADKGDQGQQAYQMGQRELLTAKIHYWTNEFPESRTASEQAAEHDPDNAQAWFYLGESERQLNNPCCCTEGV